MTLEEEAEWARCAPWIEAAMHHGADGTTLEEIKDAIAAGWMKFWPAEDAAVVTQIAGRSRKELNIYLAGGNMYRLREMLPMLEDFAREHGCMCVSITGRLGWAKTFLTRDLGYQPVAILLGKAL